MMLRFDELLGLDHVVARQDVEGGQLTLHCLPVGVILCFHARGVKCVAWHQMLVAKLVANVVGFSDTIGAAELKLEDLLGWGLTEGISEPIIAIGKLLRLYQVFVVGAAGARPCQAPLLHRAAIAWGEHGRAAKSLPDFHEI
eukprot:CAMPEP_0170475128 /NCGR_PEP_ID=MMETSP0123-20130129/16839_1 /TAXON_ID=182087 /ORGANISM="Favella ehrenbergii, Strain Fehren 1" /LENGTH=141 /DNA_ID=CAMNT_0010745449 /DNA_START=1386 /DNA_END=1811 /DNA_ORIENTATION=+